MPGTQEALKYYYCYYNQQVGIDVCKKLGVQDC